MSNYTMLLIIVTVVICVFGGICLLIPYLVRKGINISGILSGTGSALDAAGIVVDGIKEFVPETPSLCIVERIIDYAKTAVNAAEQMYKASQIAADERNAKATEIVYKLLEAADIEETDKLKDVVDGCIEAAVFVLPKTTT